LEIFVPCCDQWELAARILSNNAQRNLSPNPVFPNMPYLGI
jgi:hypothetical protein